MKSCVSKVTHQSNCVLHTQQTVATGRAQLLHAAPQEHVARDETEGDGNAPDLRAAYVCSSQDNGPRSLILNAVIDPHQREQQPQ